jgi:hypothetical protein
MSIINGVWLIVVLLRVIFTSSISLGVLLFISSESPRMRSFLCEIRGTESLRVLAYADLEVLP